MAKVGLFPTDTPIIAVDGGRVVRTLLLAAVFLFLWISSHPFEDLTAAREVTDAGNLANQLGFSTLLILLAVWCLAHEPHRLLLLVRPILIATLLWFALTVVTSWEPSLSARRLAFTLVTMGIAGMILLLPNNVRHFSNVMAAVVLFVLAACYLGVFLLPSFAIHQAQDFVEPELAGDWRGVFGHKNEAGATMAAFVFIGLFVARVRSITVGALIVVLAWIFLFFTQSKTSIAMLPVTLLASTIVARMRRPSVGIALALSPVVIFNLFSMGSIYIEPIHNLLADILPDATFTGRTDVWQFALQHLAQRPLLGYGFSAFWGTPEVAYGMGGSYIWANTASHAHNAYLDLAVTVGIPGAALVVLWLVVLPLIDFFRSSREPTAAPLKMLFLRVCLFSAYASCFETMLLQGAALDLFLFTAAFGLRFLAMTRVTR